MDKLKRFKQQMQEEKLLLAQCQKQLLACTDFEDQTYLELQVEQHKANIKYYKYELKQLTPTEN